jgi:hypothetical protein
MNKRNDQFRTRRKEKEGQELVRHAGKYCCGGQVGESFAEHVDTERLVHWREVFGED